VEPSPDIEYAVTTRHLTVTYGADPAIWNVNVEIPRWGMTGIIGPNGAGKSTLLKAILGTVPRLSGTIEFPTLKERSAGKPDGSLIGYVPQRNSVDWDFPTTVFDVVMMGTYGRLRWFQRPGKQERQDTRAALEKVRMEDFADRQIGELSGGQQQRVFLARAFVQNPLIYLMDEPFAGVDAKTENLLMEIFHALRDEGKTIVMVHHDLCCVQKYFDHVVMLNKSLIAYGQTATEFSSKNIQRCYGVDSDSLVTFGSGVEPELKGVSSGTP
jgi:manganese/zinc/iron transport system ATP- binding protein